MSLEAALSGGRVEERSCSRSRTGEPVIAAVAVKIIAERMHRRIERQMDSIAAKSRTVGATEADDRQPQFSSYVTRAQQLTVARSFEVVEQAIAPPETS